MKLRRAAAALLVGPALAVVAAGSAAAVSAAPSTAAPASTVAAQQAANSADAQFVEMMIPHHFQALVMSRLAPERSSNPELLALADRIDVEQGLEIDMMQGWQGWNGLPVTDAESAYQEMLGHPAHLEQMGMATPAEMEALSASSGTAFDRMYLELMIEHHEGALDMLLDIIVNGQDETLGFWANDMMVTQYAQVGQMQEMLADLP